VSTDLDSRIATMEKSVVATKTELKGAQDRWDDWRAGNLKVKLAREVWLLKDLYAQRAASKPPGGDRPSGQVFYGSRF
jgi:hypothetical protein